MPSIQARKATPPIQSSLPAILAATLFLGPIGKSVAFHPSLLRPVGPFAPPNRPFRRDGGTTLPAVPGGGNAYDASDEYSRCLTPKQLKKDVLNEGDVSPIDEDPRWKRALLRPIKSMRQRLFHTVKPGNLILVKCGESAGKQNNTFTGWSDPDLTERGKRECEHAALLLLEAGYDPDIIYTSRLKRAIHSVWVMTQELNSAYLPVFKSWRLNERMYGSLQGLNKRETAKRVGKDVVQAWRRSLKARPPAVKSGDENDPRTDRRYADLTDDQIPSSESLLDCMDRTLPLWEYKILPQLRKGNNVMVVAHSNSIRGLAKIIDDVGDKEIESIRFPSGIPVVYKFDLDMNPIPPEEGSLTPIHTSGTFLEKPGLLKEALQRQEDWKKTVPGTSASDDIKNKVKRMSTIEESLLRLKEEKEMEKWAQQFVHSVDGDPDGVQLANGDIKDEEADDGSEFEEVVNGGNTLPEPETPVNTNMNMFPIDTKKDPVVVFIRHGTTPHNQLALFTGWEDPPLAETGVEDAKRAGRLLRKHNFEFDVVYTSWLARAIQTAWYVLDELDMQWLPMVKSWRLNERHYGALTGKSKKMIGNIYGIDQLKKWRRGFNIPPPPASSYSFSYPGNDYKRTKYVKDLRISFTESFCRSIEARKIEIHRKFPKSESLKMCMDRTIPFYTERIVPQAVAKGKRVLITSHENAIRGILMHLCEIPEEHMNELHLPNGLPLIYNVRRKCISLLDDGSGDDPLEKYDFGSAAQFLFRPCELLEEDFLVGDDEASPLTSSVPADSRETIEA